MAAFVTSAAGGGSSGTADRTVTFSPTAGQLLLVYVVASANANRTPTMSDNLTGGSTYTLVTTSGYSTDANMMSLFVRDKLIPVNTTVTITAGTGNNTSGELVVVAVSGMFRTGLTAILQYAVAQNQSAGTPATSFAANALTGNFTLGGIGSLTSAATVLAPTNWTEWQDVGQTNPQVGLEVVTRDSGFTASTITWGSATANRFALIMAELDSSPSVFSVTGQATVTGVGQSTAKTTGSADGQATVSGVGDSIVPFTGAPEGFRVTEDGDYRIVEVSGRRLTENAWEAVAATAGQATIVGNFLATGTMVGAAAASATVTGIGKSTALTVGNAAGAATVTGISNALAVSVGTAAGAATVTGVGRSTALTVGTAGASATVTGVAIAAVISVGSTTGQATVTGIAQATGLGVGNAPGAATVTGIARSTALTVGNAPGAATVTGVSLANAVSVGTAGASATVTGVGKSTSLTVGNAAAQASVTGVGQSTALTVGNAAGQATVTGVGESIVAGESIFAITGTATVTGISLATALAVGSADGVATVLGIGQSDALASFSITGQATVTGVGDSSVQGESIFNVTGDATVAGVGLAEAVSVASADGVATVQGVGLFTGGEAQEPRRGMAYWYRDHGRRKRFSDEDEKRKRIELGILKVLPKKAKVPEVLETIEEEIDEAIEFEPRINEADLVSRIASQIREDLRTAQTESISLRQAIQEREDEEEEFATMLLLSSLPARRTGQLNRGAFHA